MDLFHFFDLHTFQMTDLLIVLVLVIMEGLLSCDNAVVLALLVKDLPPEQRGKALRYGIIGAYVFRFIAILLATWIVSIWWLKVAGGVYLAWMAVAHFLQKEEKDADGEPTKHQVTRVLGLSIFWSTVVWVELTDIVFSVDSIAAAVALSSKLWILILGGLLGILAMRFAAQGFVRLLEIFPKLEACAFIAVGVIGMKLLLEVPVDLWTTPKPVPATYASAAEYAKLAHAASAPAFSLGHAITVNRTCAAAPDDALLTKAVRSDIVREQPTLAGEALEAEVVNRAGREVREARAHWNLTLRPLIHIEGWVSSILIALIFAAGFLHRKKDVQPIA